MIHKKAVFTTIAITFAGMIAGAPAAYAELPPGVKPYTEFKGNITGVWNDPGKYFVFNLNATGPCGGISVAVDRTKENYKEMVAMVLTAVATRKVVGGYVVDCTKGTKIDIHNYNIISHGFIVP